MAERLALMSAVPKIHGLSPGQTLKFFNKVHLKICQKVMGSSPSDGLLTLIHPQFHETSAEHTLCYHRSAKNKFQFKDL